MQLPNDSNTSLMDNQTEYPADDPDYLKELDTASQYGEEVIGTLCDIEEIIDESGNALPLEYSVLLTRNGAALTSEFTIFLPEGWDTSEVQIKICVGMNEGLDSRFSLIESIVIDVPLRF